MDGFITSALTHLNVMHYYFGDSQHPIPPHVSSSPTSRVHIEIHHFLNQDWSMFWPTMFATFGGAFLGLITALYIDHRAKKQHAEAKKAELTQRQQTVRSLVFDELQRNVAELNDLRTCLNSGTVSASAPTLNVWRALSTEILSFNPDQLIVSAYYNLERVQHLLAIYQQESKSDEYEIIRANEQILPQLRVTVSRAITDCETLIANSLLLKGA